MFLCGQVPGGKINRRVALITGASSGIGIELATLLGRDGSDLVIVANDGVQLAKVGAGLREQFGIKVKCIAKDLTAPTAAQEVFDEVSESGIRIDTLVNCAGFGLFGPFRDTDLSRELQMIQLNVTTLTQLTKYFIPMLLDAKPGRVLNVASTAAFQPGPLMAVYYASKAYVLSFSEALADEFSACLSSR